VKIVIDTPKELTAIERELYEKIKSQRTTDPRRHLRQVQI
ncbi:MAG: J domain-containing protein, partial [Microcystis panniformis]